MYLEAASARVACPEHGVVAAELRWGDANSRLTYEFEHLEHQCAWLCTQTNRSAVSALMRVSWRTVGRIVDRVVHVEVLGDASGRTTDGRLQMGSVFMPGSALGTGS